MAGANTLEFTDANFDAEVINSDTPVLVDFWAEWCMPCKSLAPTIDAVADEFAGKAKVGKVDIEAARDIAMKYNIGAIPTVLIFKGGEMAKQFVGLTSKDDLASALNELS
ncbi:MAG: thioredoxin [Phycisphaerales bacterium]|nr:thioredoxin [Phycisphaerales bacterium]